MQYARIEENEKQLKLIEAQINERLKPYQEEIELLTTIPGVDKHVAHVIIAELSVDVSAFATGKQLVRWAGLAPGDNMSAGKRRNSNITPGNPYLRAMLVQAAHAAARTKNTYLREKFYRLKSRRGPKRAAVAIARKIAISAFHILKTKKPYKELGSTYLDMRGKQQVTTALVKRLTNLGYSVSLEAKAEATATS